MNRDDVRDAILEMADEGDEDQLLEMSVMSTRPALYEAAVDQFGGWDAALVAVIVELSQSPRRSSSPRRTPEESVERSPDASAREPIFLTTDLGKLYLQSGPRIAVSDALRHLTTPRGAGEVRALEHLGDPSGVLVFTDRGRYFALDARMVPVFADDAPYRDITDILTMKSGERVRHLLARDDARRGRLIHITRGAKGKATDVHEINYTLDYEGYEAFLLNDGDEPVAVFNCQEEDHVFCASANGLGILFESSELRSMGRRAVGVNVMKLADDDDAVVGAFIGEGVENVAVITREGLAKRVRFDEFRPQGRAGAGMQLAKLNDGDVVASVAPCEPSQDLALVTSAGRVQRMPAHHFPLMGRPAKGDSIVELDADEHITGVFALPCSTT